MITIADKQAERDRYSWWCWCWCWWSWCWWRWRLFPLPTSRLRGAAIAGGDNHDGYENDRSPSQTGRLADEFGSSLCKTKFHQKIFFVRCCYVLCCCPSPDPTSSGHGSSSSSSRVQQQSSLTTSQAGGGGGGGGGGGICQAVNQGAPCRQSAGDQPSACTACTGALKYSQTIFVKIFGMDLKKFGIGFDLWTCNWHYRNAHMQYLWSVVKGEQLKMWNRQKKNGAGVLGGWALVGLNASLIFISRAPVDFSVPVFKGYARNPSVPYS